LRPLIGQSAEEQPFVDWLTSYIGGNEAANGQIAILDLSLVPSEIVHIVIAVLARLVFEATHRYRKLNNAELPTILVLEEAHNFIQQHAPQTEEATVTPIQMCRSVFERSREKAVSLASAWYCRLSGLPNCLPQSWLNATPSFCTES